MNKIARGSAKGREELFTESAAKRGVRPTIIEKDFWVCFVLKLLFEDSPYRTNLVFKGGTSLSKAYGLIERFSEDIDLVLDSKLLGFPEDHLAQAFQSKNKQDKFNKEINRLAGEFITQKVVPELNALFGSLHMGLTASLHETDPQVVNIRYPASFSEEYIRPEVRLEIGPLASWVPSEERVIRPYAAEIFPEVFENPSCSVLTITAERTFWEKATILHQEAHREGLIPQRHSRHYYDLERLAGSAVKGKALADVNLLKDVVEFKSRFYPSAWARYDLAVPGSLRILPSGKEKMAGLERDYEAMKLMLFGEAPRFSEIVDRLSSLEKEINELNPE